MLLLLDLLLSSILESPLHNVGLRGCTLDMTALVELAPEFVEVLQFDQMPDLGERSGYNGALGDGRGGGDAVRHGRLLASVEKILDTTLT